MTDFTISQDDRCLRTAEAAEYLGLSQKTLQMYRYDGIGSAFVRFGKTVRYRLSDIKAWRDSRLCNPGKKEK